MGIAVFMILDQLQIAPEIVQISYTALIGAIALGLALAFGLGGRDIAGQLLSEAYDRGRQQTDQVRADLQTGKERGRRDAQQARERAEAEVQGAGSGSSGGGAPTGDARPQG
ncbi:MAG: hypothetical protein M3N16_03560 [Actinomycetota bacterium]|nr:hypothetical protein [Actinomycetota bacterium]